MHLMLLFRGKRMKWGRYQVVHTYGALRDLVPCAQFKKREKHLWRSVTFSKFAG